MPQLARSSSIASVSPPPIASVMRIVVPFLVLGFAACSGESIETKTFTTVVSVNGEADTRHIKELVRKNATGGTLMQRDIASSLAPNDAMRLVATFDAEGLLLSASFRREGPLGKRYVELRQQGPDRVLFSRGNDETVVVPRLRLGLVGVPPPASAQASIDVENARIVRAGALAPHTNDAIEPRHRLPEPLIESAASIVTKWCRLHSAQPAPLSAAAEFAGAIAPKISDERRHGPPSAQNTVLFGGDRRGASALLVACLRQAGFAARVVHSARPEPPQTWAQVHDGTQFVDVDALNGRAIVATATGEGIAP